MAAPVVQTLDQVMAELAPGYAQQQGVITQQQQALTGQTAAKKTALDAEKVKGFNTINNQATGRGASFSGIPLEEQADYLSTKYLPGLQAADAEERQGKLSLAMEMARLGTEQRNNAMGVVRDQQGALNSWNMQQQQIQAQERQAAAARAASSKEASNSAASRRGVIESLNQKFQSAWGRDKYVSPVTFRALYQEAASAGMGVDDYYSTFGRYINRSHEKDYRI